MSDRQFRVVPIYKGNDLARLAELNQVVITARRKYEQAQQSGTSRGGDDFGLQAAKDAYDEFVAEASPRATMVRVEALGRRQWRALLNEHPPRRVTRLIDGAQTEVVHDDDEELGVNTDSLPEVLLTYVDPKRPDMKTIVEPEFPTAESRLEWLDDLSGGDFDKLFLTAFTLNGSIGLDPKATTFGSGSPSSPETSE